MNAAAGAVTDELSRRLLRVKLFLVDVDGVMTDGRIVYGNYGDELKFFDVQDGFGMVLLRRAGLKTVIVSGKKSRVNPRRVKELGVDKLYQNAFDKLKILEQILKKFKVKADEVCYIGDDLIDLPVLKRVGFSAAPANAVDEVKKAVHHCTEKPGGRGAARELAEMILKAQGRWAAVTERYFR